MQSLAGLNSVHGPKFINSMDDTLQDFFMKNTKISNVLQFYPTFVLYVVETTLISHNKEMEESDLATVLPLGILIHP